MTNPETSGQPFATPEQEVKGIGTILFAILLFVFSAVSISLATFFRRDFGSRYYTIITFLIGLIFMNFMKLSTASMAVNRGGIGGVQLLPFFTTAFLFVGLFHFWKIWVNRKLNHHILSYHDGRSHLEPIAEWISDRPTNPVFRAIVAFIGRFTLSVQDRERLNNIMMAVPSIRDTDRFAKMWLEPAFGVVLALILAADHFVFLWLIFASASLFVSSYLIIRERRRRELDMLDNMAHAQEQRRVMEIERQIEEQTRQLSKPVEATSVNLPPLELTPKDLNPDLTAALAELSIDVQSQQ